MKIFILALFWISGLAHAKEFSEEVEKDYPLRSMARLQVVNAKGDITVQGWTHDKIRIKLRKQVEAESLEKARPLLDGIDYRYRVSDDHIEISNQYGTESSIEDRLQEREKKRARSDMIIYAPSKLKLTLWTIDGKVWLKAWNAKVDVRSNSGVIQVDSMKGEKISVNCFSCTGYLRNIRANLHCFSKSGLFNLHHISGKSVFVESETGTIKLSQVEGNQLYIVQNGSITGRLLAGKIEYHAAQGNVELQEVTGSLSGTTDSGNFTGSVREWSSQEETLLESVRGSISLALPRSFSADVDLWSIQGTTKLDFPLERLQSSTAVGPEPANHFFGRVKDGGGLLKILSEFGDISVAKR